MLWKGYLWLAFALCISTTLCRTKLGPNNVVEKEISGKGKRGQLKQERILPSEASERDPKPRKLSVDGSLASSILKKQSAKAVVESSAANSQQPTSSSEQTKMSAAESYTKSLVREKSMASDILNSLSTQGRDGRQRDGAKSIETTSSQLTKPKLSILEDDDFNNLVSDTADVFISSFTRSKEKIKVQPKKTVSVKKQIEERKASKSATVKAMRLIVEDDEDDEGDKDSLADEQTSGSGGSGSGSGFSWSLGNIWSRALRQSRYEQEVEDLNALQKVDDSMVRRLIVMPLTDSFKPHQADMMHGKIQYGDRCSLPASLGKLIFEKRYEVPWLFEVVPVRKINSKHAPDRLQQGIIPVRNNSHLEGTNISQPLLNKAYMSPLDFRSPENYIFLPRWLMTDLGLQANDLVDISMVRIKLAELVVVQPLSLDWDKLIEQHGDPKSLLEHELSRYSSLTSKSTIVLNINGKEYPFYVKDTKAEGGVSVKGVRVQDADIRTDIDRSVLDKMIEAKKSKNAKKPTKTVADSE